ncbi:hypothetical protein BaRGS_00022272 [Batillaria attramentaria]|uniref:Acetylcholinesterase n=1 Tax=Batillaria attramentaria TaxID=370345 RepID=A0ABD0KHS3_9CAEN
MEVECFISVFLVTLLSLMQDLPFASGYGLIVDTDKGKVQGKTIYANDKKVDVFLGIPFAKPPLGDLRFKHPEQIDKWEGVKNATVQPNTCVQGYDSTFGNFSGSMMWNPNTKVSEDCLYLNVWVPRTNPPYKNKAVMVWIYGGGFYSGSVTLDIYDARYLAAENDVIVVSMNYRVGVLGFLVLNTPGARGNAGMMDQRLGLEWVQRNIGYFGGNPHNVTIFGESAGASSVGLHLLSSLSRGLFNRAILESGAPQAKWVTFTAEEGRTRSRRLAHEQLGCDKSASDAEILQCLRNIPGKQFYENEFNVVNGIVQFPFLPVIDGFFLTESPSQYLKSGRFKKAPLLLGSNSHEGSWFLVYEAPDYFKIDSQSLIKEEDMEVIIESLFLYHPHFKTPPTIINQFGRDAIIFEYTDWVNPKDDASRRDRISLAVGDYHFVCEVNALADRYAQSGQRVYNYWFQHRSSVNPWPAWMGTLHADEIMFVFGLPLDPARGYSEEEKQLSRKMMRFWTNFAKTGYGIQRTTSNILKAQLPKVDSRLMLRKSGVFRVSNDPATITTQHRCSQGSEPRPRGVIYARVARVSASREKIPQPEFGHVADWMAAITQRGSGKAVRVLATIPPHACGWHHSSTDPEGIIQEIIDRSKLPPRSPLGAAHAFLFSITPADMQETKRIPETSDITSMEKEWKVEFHEWKTRYIVDWKNQFDNFLNNYEKRLKTCGVP